MEDKLKKQEQEYLDTLDLYTIISLLSDHTVSQIMSRIQIVYEAAYLRRNQDTGLFGHMTEDNFIDYINKRYNIHYIENITHYFDL